MTNKELITIGYDFTENYLHSLHPMDIYKSKAVYTALFFCLLMGGIFWEIYQFMEIDLRGLLQNFHEIKNRNFTK